MESIEDLKLKCLVGIPIILNDDISIKPKTLREIIQIGFETYNKMVSYTLIDEKEANMTTCRYLKDICLENEKYRDAILYSLQYLFGNNIAVNNDGFAYINKDNNYIPITEEVFNDAIQIIKIQNCFYKFNEDEDEFNPSSEKARQIIEKTLKARKKVAELKNQESGESESITLFDLTSIVSTNCNGLSILNVWDLTFFQLNNQFNRMAMLDNYKINIRSMLAGASDVELTNWMSKL
jgi:hypothetical protein